MVTVSEAKEFLDKSFGMQYCISTEKGVLWNNENADVYVFLDILFYTPSMSKNKNLLIITSPI